MLAMVKKAFWPAPEMTDRQQLYCLVNCIVLELALFALYLLFKVTQMVLPALILFVVLLASSTLLGVVARRAWEMRK